MHANRLYEAGIRELLESITTAGRSLDGTRSEPIRSCLRKTLPRGPLARRGPLRPRATHGWGSRVCRGRAHLPAGLEIPAALRHAPQASQRPIRNSYSCTQIGQLASLPGVELDAMIPLGARRKQILRDRRFRRGCWPARKPRCADGARRRPAGPGDRRRGRARVGGVLLPLVLGCPDGRPPARCGGGRVRRAARAGWHES
jgi:hypothetical protein